MPRSGPATTSATGHRSKASAASRNRSGRIARSRFIVLVIIIGVIISTGAMNFGAIVAAQDGDWGLFNWYWLPHLPMVVLFFISALAETNRPPFDLVEAESELVAGFNVDDYRVFNQTRCGDNLDGTGNNLENNLVGNDGSNLLTGLDGDDVLETYLTALAHVYDPHSDYFNPKE